MRTAARSTFLAVGSVLALLLVAGDEGDRRAERERMVEEQIAARGVVDPRVLEAMRTVPRHRFVPTAVAEHAYDDGPLPIGREQTISQPFIVAKMTELLALRPTDKVYELGTGSGYQAAVAARVGARVFSVEIEPELAARARATLAALGVSNVAVRTGDGYAGWPEEAPFDAMILTAAVPTIPEELLEQLKPGGRAVMPVGPAGGIQELQLVEKRPDGRLVTKSVFAVRFVPARRPAR